MHRKDLHIIQKLFFKTVDFSIVLDPLQSSTGQEYEAFHFVNSESEVQKLLDQNPTDKIVVFNLSKKKTDFRFDQPNIIASIHFNLKRAERRSQRYHFVNNNDKSIRWIFPDSNEQPTFLSLYNNTGWKAQIYKKLFKLAYQLNSYSLLVSGFFIIESKVENIDRFFTGNLVDEYAVFTGTAGENRKAILALFHKKHCTHFVKIPLTEKAQQLVLNERIQLTKLKSLKLTKMFVPIGGGGGSHLSLTNIQPKEILKANNLTDRHLLALSECYNKTVNSQSPQSISCWSAINSSIDFIQKTTIIDNGISLEKIRIIAKHLNALKQYVESSSTLPMALTHGDFTPWNMYETRNKIHVYDWEMSCFDMPLFFDAIHYIFQNSILIQRDEFATIKSKIDIVENNPIVQELIQKYETDWTKHYAFYLLYITTYYIPLYLQQKDLHLQAHWLIDCWQEAIESLREEKSIKFTVSDTILKITN